jgi:8-oxo-dGTP pyrophosphatase MutT (NUDIX family)
MYESEGLHQRLLGLLEPDPRTVPPLGTRLASVLVPVLVAGPEPRLVFTKRTDTLSRHAGEISFPGGLTDAGEDPAAAALREAEEELSLAPADVDLAGALPPVHTHVSGILIVPFVGTLRKDPLFTPNAAEIDEVLEFPLADLESVGGEREFEHDGRRFQTYVYELSGRVIWGATARILWSLIGLLRQEPSSAEG